MLNLATNARPDWSISNPTGGEINPCTINSAVPLVSTTHEDGVLTEPPDVHLNKVRFACTDQNC